MLWQAAKDSASAEIAMPRLEIDQTVCITINAPEYLKF
jgi:hypothetical protein